MANNRRAAQTLTHPADRGMEDRRTAFDRFSERVSFLASSAPFFVVCVGVVLAWLVRLVLGASNRFEATAAGLMSAMTLILVALVKNAELRAERAIQRKLDAIASALLEDKRGHSGDSDRQLESAIRIHEQI
jgi:low affinity Fe/Cu permease